MGGNKWHVAYYTPGDIDSYHKAIEELYDKMEQSVFDYFSYATLDNYVRDYRIGRQDHVKGFAYDQIALYKTKDPEKICRDMYVYDLTGHAKYDFGISFEEYKVRYKKGTLKPICPGMHIQYPSEYEDYLKQEYYPYYKFRKSKKWQKIILEQCEKNKAENLETLANGLKRTEFRLK